MPDILVGHLAGHRMLSVVPYMRLGQHKVVEVIVQAEEPGHRCFSLILMVDMMVGVKAELGSCSLSSLGDKPLVVVVVCRAYPAVEKPVRAVVGCIAHNAPSLVDKLWGVVNVCMSSVVGYMQSFPEGMMMEQCIAAVGCLTDHC